MSAGILQIYGKYTEYTQTYDILQFKRFPTGTILMYLQYEPICEMRRRVCDHLSEPAL